MAHSLSFSLSHSFSLSRTVSILHAFRRFTHTLCARSQRILQINEALDLALEAIDREQAGKQEERQGQEQEQEQLEADVELEKEKETDEVEQQNNENLVREEMKELQEKHDEAMMIKRDELMPNKTDEQKKQEVEQEHELDEKKHSERRERQEQEEQEQENRKEPIYENISSTISMQQVDSEQTAMIPRRGAAGGHRNSIPNKSNNNNNNEHNQSNNNNHNKDEEEATTTKTTAKAAATSPDAAIRHSDVEPYYQVPKATEPYYDAPKHLRPIPVYENIDIFYTGLEFSGNSNNNLALGQLSGPLEPPKEKPPPPPIEHTTMSTATELGDEDELDTGTWSSDNTYETISSSTRRQLQLQQTPAQAAQGQATPPIKRMNSTKRIKKELRNKRSSFLGIETDADLDDVDSYLELTVAPPPDMAQLLQEERRLEKQLYIKAGLCDSSDTGE